MRKGVRRESGGKRSYETEKKRDPGWKEDKKKITRATHTQPGSHQIVIWVAVGASITEGLTESLPLRLSSCRRCGSQSARSHSLTLVPITQLHTDCLAGPAAISHTYLWDNFWQNKDWLKEWQTGLWFFTGQTEGHIREEEGRTEEEGEMREAEKLEYKIETNR